MTIFKKKLMNMKKTWEALNNLLNHKTKKIPTSKCNKTLIMGLKLIAIQKELLI